MNFKNYLIISFTNQEIIFPNLHFNYLKVSFFNFKQLKNYFNHYSKFYWLEWNWEFHFKYCYFKLNYYFLSLFIYLKIYNLPIVRNFIVLKINIHYFPYFTNLHYFGENLKYFLYSNFIIYCLDYFMDFINFKYYFMRFINVMLFFIFKYVIMEHFLNFLFIFYF